MTPIAEASISPERQRGADLFVLVLNQAVRSLFAREMSLANVFVNTIAHVIESDSVWRDFFQEYDIRSYLRLGELAAWAESRYDAPQPVSQPAAPARSLSPEVPAPVLTPSPPRSREFSVPTTPARSSILPINVPRPLPAPPPKPSPKAAEPSTRRGSKRKRGVVTQAMVTDPPRAALAGRDFPEAEYEAEGKGPMRPETQVKARSLIRVPVQWCESSPRPLSSIR